MQFEITKIDVAGGLVSGLVRAGGQGLRKVAEAYMVTPNKSCPYAGGSGNLCPVESWIAKTRGEVPGGDAGDWGLVFSIRDPALIAGIREGTHKIEITKSSTGAIDFDINKSMKVNKNMSDSNEVFDQLVAERMEEIRATGSDLSEDEIREQAVAEILEVHPEFASESVEKGVREFRRLVDERINTIRKSASGPKDLRVLKAVATAEISRERPDLARAVLLAEKIESTMPPKQTVAKAAQQEPMGPAARELDRLVVARMGEIRKSAAAPNEKILKAQATTQISRERPELMRMVLNEERIADARLAYGGRF